MSSALSTAARDDVDIVYDAVPLGDESLSTLWQLMQNSCVDATQGTRQHSDIWDLAQSCIHFGTIAKLVEPPQQEESREVITTTSEATQAPREKIALRRMKRPWGYVHYSWRSPTESDPFSVGQLTEGHHDEEVQEVARLADAFHQRILAEKLPLDSQDIIQLGTLLKHGTFKVERGRDDKVLEVYLFERKLVLLPPSTARPSRSIASNLRVIRLDDIINIAPKRRSSCGHQLHGLEICSRSLTGEMSSVTLFLDDPSGKEDGIWAATISRAVSATRALRFLPQSSASPANALAPRLPLANFHAFRKFSPVTINCGSRTGECGAYLIDDMLLFITKDAYGVLRVHTSIDLATVQFVVDRSVASQHVVGVRSIVDDAVPNSAVNGVDTEHVYTDYNFGVASKQLVTEWLDALKAQLLTIDPAHPLDPPPAPKPTPPKKPEAASETPGPTWPLAGIIFLAASPESPGEYNLGVAVLPQFASDGLATYAIAQVLQKAFETLRAHRVQARIFRGDTHDTARAVAKFVQLGFTHEGVRRRAAMHPLTRCWTDVSVLSLLDVEWTVRLGVPPPPRSMWDEMFNRHQREREHLLKWDGGLKRTRSMETVKDLRALADAAPTPVGSVIEDDALSIASSVPPPSQAGASTSSWDAFSEVSQPTPEVVGRVQSWTSQLLTAAADDAADEFSSDSWDDFEDDSDDSKDTVDEGDDD